MECDVLIRGGTVVDGSGSPGFTGDVAIAGGTIAGVGDLAGATAGQTVDASGRVVAPGFIDVHVHSEVALADPENPYRYGGVLQGVTTHLAAPDGFGWAPLSPERAAELWRATSFAHGPTPFPLGWDSPDAYLAEFAGRTPANVVPQVPHCAVRLGVMGWETRAPDADETRRMGDLTRAWLEAGAKCLNVGLDYQPSAFATTEELVALSRVVREYGGLYAAHIRYNGLGRVEAWREIMRIGAEAGVPVHVSHERVDEEAAGLLAEAEGVCDLTFESYLYPASCTHLALMLPLWAQAGGPEGIRRRLDDPETRALIRDEMQSRLSNDPQRARMVCVDDQTGRFVGEELIALAERTGEPIGELAVRVLDEEFPYALMVYHRAVSPEGQDRVVRDTIRHPKMLVASDGMYHGVSAHPRGYGCFAQVLRLCVREQGAVSLEEAVRKMSGFPAERFGIPGRGLIREGFGADLVIFDPGTVADRATWDEPRAEPVGIDRVIVNGETVVLDGRPTGALPGVIIRC